MSSNAVAASLQRAYTICFQSAYHAEFDAVVTCTNFCELCVFRDVGLAEDVETCRSVIRVAIRYPITKTDAKRNGTKVRTTCYSLRTVGDLLVGGCVGALLVWKWRDLIENRYDPSQIDLEIDPVCTFDVPEVSAIYQLPNSETTVVCGSGDGQIRLVDLGAHREQSRCVGHTDAVHSVSARDAANQHEFVSAGEDGSARIWDVRTCRSVVHADLRKMLASETSKLWKRRALSCRFALAASSDWLVVGGTFEPVLFHAGTRSVLKHYPANSLECDTEFLTAALSVGGDRVLFGAADGRVLHFDTFESNPLAAFSVREQIAHVYDIGVVKIESDCAMQVDTNEVRSKCGDVYRTIVCGAGAQLNVCDELGCTLKRLFL